MWKVSPSPLLLRSPARYLPVAAVVALAISAIHPFIAAMAAVALTGFAGLHLLLGIRSRAAWRNAVLVGVLVALVMALPLVELALSRGDDALAASFPTSLADWPVGMRSVPVLPGVRLPTLAYDGPLPDLDRLDAGQAGTADDPFLQWRFAVNMGRRRLLLFDLHRYIADPNLLFEPPYLLALLILPFLARGIRRDAGAQFAVGSTGAVLTVMFVPWLTPLVGALVMPWILWRLVWVIPYALIVGMGVQRVADGGWRIAHGKPEMDAPKIPSAPPLPRRGSSASLLLLAALLLSPLIARNLRNLTERTQYPAFFPAPAGLFAALAQEIAATGRESVVLAPPDLSVTIPAYIARAAVVAHRAPTTSEIFPAGRQSEALQRLIDQDAFFATPYLTERSLAVLRRWGVDFVAVPAGTRLEAQLQLAPARFRWLADDASYSLYAVAAPATPDDAVRGNGLLYARRWADARAAYQRALAANPRDLVALAGMAELQHTLGDFDGALATLDAALAAADAPVLHYRRGLLLEEMGRLEEAQVALARARDAAPHVAAYHAAVGDACLTAGDLTCAANAFVLAAAVQPLPGEDARRIAEADLWRQRGRPDRAVPRYAEAARLRPTPYNRLLLITALREAGDLDGAAAEAEGLRRDHPLNAAVLTAAADVTAALGRPADAAALYRRAVFLLELQAQDETDTRLALAHTLLDMGLPAAAGRHVAVALARQPGNAEAHRLQGDLLKKQGDAAGALRAYQRAFALDPAQIGTYLALRNQLRAQGAAPDEAESLMDRAAAYNPSEAALALDRGDHLQRAGDSRGALDAYRQALEALSEQASGAGPAGAPPANGSRAFVFARLAELHGDLAEPREALNFGRAAIAASRGAAWAQRALGDALRRRGDAAGAEAAYRAALAADPEDVDAHERLADLLRARGDDAGAQAIRDQLPDLAVARLEAPLTAPALAALAAGGGSAALQSDETLLARPLPATRADGLDAGAQLIAAEEDASALRVLAAARATAGQAARAEALYRNRIVLAETQGWDPVIIARYWSHLGALALAGGNLDVAADAYRRALALDGWRPDAYLGLASVAAARGQTGEALVQARHAVRAAPGSVEARLALAASLEAFGGNEEARFLYETTAQAHPGNAQALLALARTLQAAGESDAAERRYAAARDAAPGMAAPYIGLADLAYRQRGDADAATALLQQARVADRADPLPVLLLAEMAAIRGDAVAADGFFAEATARATDATAPALAAALLHDARYAEARAFLEARLADRPGDAALLAAQAQALRALGEPQAAATSLRRAAAMAPTDGRALAALADLYRAQGRLAEALAASMDAADREPEAAAAVVGVAATQAAMGDRAGALAVLADARQRVSQPEVLDALAHDLWMLRGDVTAAEAILAHAPSGALGSAMLRAAHAAARGDLASAERQYRVIAADNPREAAPRLALSELALRSGNRDDALAQAQAAAQIAPANPAAWLAVGRGLDAAGRADEAIAADTRAIRLAPAAPEGYLALAGLHAAADRDEDARAVYATGARAAPGNPALLEAYGLFLVAQGEADAAARMLDAAVSAFPGAAMRYARAAVLAEAGRTDRGRDARSDLEAAILAEPGTLEPRLALGDLLRDAGDADAARRVYEAAAARAPGHPAPYLRLAALAETAGDDAEAAAWRAKADGAALAGLR